MDYHIHLSVARPTSMKQRLIPSLLTFLNAYRVIEVLIIVWLHITARSTSTNITASMFMRELSCAHTEFANMVSAKLLLTLAQLSMHCRKRHSEDLVQGTKSYRYRHICCQKLRDFNAVRYRLVACVVALRQAPFTVYGVKIPL